MPVYDASFTSRETSDGALAATAVVGPFDIGGTPLRGMAFQVYVPVVDTATDATLSVRVRASTASTPATTDQIISEKSLLDQGTGFYYVPFTTRKRSVSAELVVGGTSPDFSAVTLHLVDYPFHEWTRTTEFR
jgi:hypothetical protein